MSIVRVSNHLDDLARDAERSSNVPTRRLRAVVEESIEDGNRFAKASASEQHTMFGDTDIEYAPSFTSEMTGHLQGEYGSDHSIGDGTQATGYEYGSRNSPPHHDHDKSFDYIKPKFRAGVARVAEEMSLGN